MRSLKNAVSDARTIGEILKDQAFSVVCLENATRLQLIAGLGELGSHMRKRQAEVGARKGQVSVVFYAGHGFATPANDFLLLAPEPCPDAQACAPPSRDDLALEVVELDAIVGQEGSTSFDRIVMVDACRTPLEDGIGRLAGRGAAHFGRYPRPSRTSDAVFVMSTTDGEMAIDKHDLLGADSNGLFVSRLRQILTFDHIGMDDVFFTTRAAFSVLSDPAVKQRPIAHPYQNFMREKGLRAKAEQVDACSAAFDRNLWRFSQCRERGEECAQAYCNFARVFCDGQQCLSQAEKTCLHPLLISIRSDHETFCKRYPEGPQRTARVRLQPAFNSIPTAQLHSFARASRQTAAQASQLDAIASADVRVRAPNQHARWEDVVRPDLLRPIRPETRAPIDLTLDAGQTIRVRELPNAASGTKRIAAPGDRLVADCFSQPCPEGWMGVRLNAEGTVFRGWITFQEAAALATINAADEVFNFSFVADTSRPDDRELQRLTARIRELGPNRSLAAAIVVSQPGETFSDASNADARVARLRSALELGGVPAQNIAPAIEVVPVSRQAVGTVRLSIR